MSEATFTGLSPGTMLVERYRVQEMLGEGTSAAVYLAHDELLGRRVALKVLDPLRGADPVGRARFEREYQVLSRLAHPHIARCHALEAHGELELLVMEFVEGETLADRLVSGRLHYDEAIAIASDLADALHTCHSAGVLHRDLKPANIMLHPERGAVILDFGVAWFSSAVNLTRTGAAIGTPRYMAPEVFSGALTDERTDLYSLGVCLYEMVCGRPPHFFESVAELAMAVHRHTPPRVSTVVPGVPSAFDDVVARAIAFGPEERYATATEMKAALVRGHVESTGILRNSVPCERCATSRIITLPFCPGCGAPASWGLEPGPNAVQLTSVPDIDAVVSWLDARYPDELRRSRPALRARLRHLPVPLAVGVSARSADQLVAEASDLGVVGEVVRARAIVGARLRGSDASRVEVCAALGGHYVLFTTLCAGVVVSGMSNDWVGWFTGVGTLLVSVLGAVLLQPYIRRPLLRLRQRGSGRPAALDCDAARVQSRLAALQHPRARRLAAAVISRALPVLTPRADGMEPWARHEILMALDDALEAIRQVDVHARLLRARPRSRLAVELDAAKRQLEGGQPDATERVRELEEERDALLAASIAHDLGTRESLKACVRIMDVTREMALIAPPKTFAAEGAKGPRIWARLLPLLSGH
ncbi:MAG: serine/threonine-protein kinase [Myxococcota bacterium]